MPELLTEAAARSIREEPRFRGIKQFHNRRTALDSPILNGGEMEYISRGLEPGPPGEHVAALEEELARFIGVKHAVALASGTAAMHLAVRLAAEKIYGGTDCGSECRNGNFGGTSAYGNVGTLCRRKVFCSDLTASAMVTPVLYEGGEPVFIDVSPGDWGMDPEALELAFDRYPDVKLVIMAHIYGFPGQIRRVREICERHGALLIEDACQSLGAATGGKQTGSFGDYGVLNFGSGSIMTGAGGGMLLINDSCELAQRASRYDRTEYGSRMGDMAAAMIRGQMKHLDERIAKKKAIYERYEEYFSEDLMLLNPIGKDTEPNFQTSCMTVESSILFQETRSEQGYEYQSRHGTAAPMEILDALEAFGLKGSPVWKPMHMQPIFRKYDQVTLDGSRVEWGRGKHGEAKHEDFWVRSNESADIFQKGLCLPSYVGITEEEQEWVMEIVCSCYSERGMWRAI